MLPPMSEAQRMVQMDEMFPEDYVAERIENEIAREEAEKAGVFDAPRFTGEQAEAFYSAMATLNDLAKETNSTLSELLKMYAA